MTGGGTGPYGGLAPGPTWALVHIDPVKLTTSYTFHPSEVAAAAASTDRRDLIIDLTRFRRARNENEKEQVEDEDEDEENDD